ncbi:MAG: metallopeptidase TldD-related protein, partial [Betaproteobacteria bacterium]|nr:metallopeptidase TldD-related protein [Betaproteobacteria bacterium]
MTKNALKAADRYLLSPHNLGQEELEKALRKLMRHDIDYGDLYFQYSRAEGWGLEEGIVKSGSFSIEEGVGVRAVSGEKTAFAYSDDISMDALLDAVRVTRAIGASDGKQKVKVTPCKPPPRLYRADDPLASLDDTAKVQLLERLEAFARAADTRVIQVIAGLAGTWEVVLVARSDGHMAADIRPLVRVSLTVIMEENGRREQGSAGGGGRFDYGYFTDEILRGYALAAVHQARVNLEAVPAPAGVMTVVLGSGWPGILLHEAIGHGLEGDFNRKGSSAFSGRIGEQVAARGVTVVDDGSLPDRRGSLAIDDEGNPGARTVLIEDGILTGYMQDMTNARLMGMKTTGNG